MPYTFQTLPFNANSLSFSPYNDSLLAVASSQNFGLVGNGRCHILRLSPAGIKPLNQFDTQDGLYDCAWSEVHENQLVVASGDGTIKLFDITLKEFPVQSWKEHSREVFSVHWSPTEKQTFVSASWDTTIKTWHPSRPQSISTFKGHSACVYAALYSPHTPQIIASCSGDSKLILWDTRQPTPTTQIQAHPNAEVLYLDWNKYKPLTLHTCSNDCTINTFDARNPRSPLSRLQGHSLAVRKVAASPHSGNLLTSASYDMTVRVWDLELGRCVALWDRHTEFAYGVEWSLFGEGWIGSVGWDGKVYVGDWAREWRKL